MPSEANPERTLDTEFIDGFPARFPRAADSVFARWCSAHQDVFDTADLALAQVIASHYLSRASVTSLENAGARYGELGQRFGRGGAAYANYLASLVDSFSGRGTNSDIRFAVAAAARTSPEDIEIAEDYINHEYELTLADWSAHEVELLHRTTDIAEPSLVKLREPVRYRTDTARVTVSEGTSAPNRSYKFPAERLALFVAPVERTTTSTSGFGDGTFDGSGTFDGNRGVKADSAQ